MYGSVGKGVHRTPPDAVENGAKLILSYMREGESCGKSAVGVYDATMATAAQK